MITLRKIQEADLENLMNWRMDPDVTRYMNTDPVLTLEGQKKWLEGLEAIEREEKPASLHWIIEIDGQAAGLIQVLGIDWETKLCSWGYYIGEKKLRSLKAALALEMSLYDFAFFNLGMERIHNDVFTENASVIKLHEACGCKVEEIVKGEIVKNGIAYDVAHSYIYKDVWESLRESKKYEKVEFPYTNK